MHQKDCLIGSGGIRTHASEETGALNQRLRPLNKIIEPIDAKNKCFKSNK